MLRTDLKKFDSNVPIAPVIQFTVLKLSNRDIKKKAGCRDQGEYLFSLHSPDDSVENYINKLLW